MIKITKQEQEIKDCLIKLLQDYNGSWNDLKKEKRYKELMKYNKANKGKKYKYVQVHTLTYMKIDEDGNDDGKIYEYNGDYSTFCDGILPDNLTEIDEKKRGII